MRRGEFILLSLGVFFENLTFGFYYSIVRPYMEQLGSPYTLIFMVDFVGAVIGLSAIFWGYLSDVLGKKPMIAAGSLGFIPLYVVSKVSDPILIVMLTAVFSLFYTISQPSILAVVSYTEKLGAAFASYTISTSMGWGLGSLLMGLIHDTLGLGVEGVFIASSLSWLIGFCLLTVLAFKVTYEGGGRIRFRIPAGIRFLFMAELFTYTGLSWCFPLITLKLHDILGGNKLLYGIVWGALPAFTGLIVSPYAGRLAERIGGVAVVRYALLFYTILIPLFSITTGIYNVALWLVPVWPLHYVGVNVAASQLTRVSERGEAMGAMNTCYNLGMILAIVGGGVADVIGRDASIFLASIPIAIGFILISLYMRRRKI